VQASADRRDAYPGERRITPTSLAEFVRVGQCERFLRLRLHDQGNTDDFLHRCGLSPHKVPPMLTSAGNVFEQEIIGKIGEHYRLESFATFRGDADHSAYIIKCIQELGPGEVRVLYQPGMTFAQSDRGWQIPGRPDLLRLERDYGGGLHLLIADIKYSAVVTIDHRLQLACYERMVRQLLDSAGIEAKSLRMGIIYRCAEPDDSLDEEAKRQLEKEREQALQLFGLEGACLQIVEDPDVFAQMLDSLLLGEDSRAERVLASRFEDVFFHLNASCDACVYSRFCLKWAYEHDDLSMIPFISTTEKSALLDAGLTKVQQVASLKRIVNGRLQTPTEQRKLVRSLRRSWALASRLDELIYRAKRYVRHRYKQGESVRSDIPDNGYSSLPICSPEMHPNLVMIYIDSQYDYLQDCIYMLGARIVAHKDGVKHRSDNVVRITSGPPDPSSERELFLDWVKNLLVALDQLAVRNENGEAPIHLVFYDRDDQQHLLESLGRHLDAIFGATNLHDFITQVAAFDSPMVTFLSEEIRRFKNLPFHCQSLYMVASDLWVNGKRFQWDGNPNFKAIFKVGIFDCWGKLSDQEDSSWYMSRPRFGSDIPLEYAYAAWGRLDPPEYFQGRGDPYAGYRRGITLDLLRAFEVRRLEAIEHIASSLEPNKYTTKKGFQLPELRDVESARTLADALEEFLTMERMVELSTWKENVQRRPEDRVLAGVSLIVRYEERLQPPEMLAEQKELLAKGKSPSRYRLVVDASGTDLSVDEILALIDLEEDSKVIISPRWTRDTRPDAPNKEPFAPTFRQILYGPRAKIDRIETEGDAQGQVREAYIDVTMRDEHGAKPLDIKHYVFHTNNKSDMAAPLQDGQQYVLDQDPNDWYGLYCALVVRGLREGRNALYERLVAPGAQRVCWPQEAAQAQALFLQGLEWLASIGYLGDMEPSKREYVGQLGEAPLLLVQGPPGTGKSTTTAYAVLARIQGAMAVEMRYRVLLSCKTHAATDVLLGKVAEVLEQLAGVRSQLPAAERERFFRYFDKRLWDLPLMRVTTREDSSSLQHPRIKLYTSNKDCLKAARELEALNWAVLGATPASIRRMIYEHWRCKLDNPACLFGHDLIECLVLDEASQMNIPEAIMAALPLKLDGQLIVVGDHRQMPPIVQHDWESELRRTFQQFKTYRSLFQTLAEMQPRPKMIKFERSYRLHKDIARFLSDQIYKRYDDLNFYSQRQDVLPALDVDDPFVRAVLSPEHPLTVVLHDESQSQTRNEFECQLLEPVLRILASPPLELDVDTGLGVVVPHRMQRMDLREHVPYIVRRDPETGQIVKSAVDTVERFQGDERDVIIVSATESDPAYLLQRSDFILDARRLNVALSRARKKLILLASRSVFDLLPPEEELFEQSLLWKALLRPSYTRLIWAGERHGHSVEVYGSVPPSGECPHPLEQHA